MTTWQGFYSTTQVSRLARIPRRTLYEWRRRGVIAPSVQIVEAGRVVDEGYSYADLTIIKILRALREDKLDLDSAGRALRHLFERLGAPSKGWVNTSVYLVGNKIYAEKPDEWDVTVATKHGQRLETRLFADLFQELRAREEPGEILVPEPYSPYVEINPYVMGGQPVVRGTRIPTSILALLRAKGKTLEHIARLYYPLARKTIEKAIQYEQFLDTATASA